MLGIWKKGDSCLKMQLHISVEAEVFIRRERGTDRDQGRGLQSSVQRSTVYSDTASDGPVCSTWFNQPGFTSSRLHGCRSANLLELGCLKVRVCTFQS